MWKKVTLLFPLLMLLVCSNVFGQWVVWDNAAGTGLWRDSGNWYGPLNIKPILPTAVDVASISISASCTVDSSTNGACDQLYIGTDATAGTLNVTGGWLNVSHTGYIGMNGAGTLNMSDGDMEIGANLNVGSATNGIINMTGGAINILNGGWLVVSSHGQIHLDGGVMHGEGGWSIDDGGKMDISGGTLTFNGNGGRDSANAFFASGKLTAYDGNGDLIVDYDPYANVTTITAIRITKSCQNGYYLSADINKDCVVDFKDLVILVQNWVKCNDYSRTECVSFYSR